jgi:hypothetical protein
MIPIAETEAAFIRTSGWEQFEDLLERANPDLLDLTRDPLRLLSRL